MESIAENKPVEFAFNGKFVHKMDSKGRVSLPADFRKCLPKDLKVTPDLQQRFLMVFTPEGVNEWVNSFFEAKGGYETNNMRHVQQRKVLNSRVRNCEIDNSGRISIPREYREIAALDKEVVIIGDNDHFEIWNVERWDEIDTQDLLCDLMS